MKRFMATLALALIIGAGSMAHGSEPTPNLKVSVNVPLCPEDAGYLRGRGDYERGAFARYVCIHNERVDLLPKQQYLTDGK